MRITRKHIGRQIRKLNRAQSAGATQQILASLRASKPTLYKAVKANW